MHAFTTACVAFLLGCLPAQGEPQPAATPVPQDDAPRAPEDRLLVCNKAEDTVSIFEPATRRELVRLPTGAGPHEVAVSPSGRLAVVTDYGAQKPGSTLTVVDIAAQEVLRTIELELIAYEGGAERRSLLLRPHGILFVTANMVAVTSESTRQLGLVDIETGKVMTVFPTSQTTMHMVARGAKAHHLAATSIREGSVALFDTRDAKIALPTIVATGAGAEGIAVSPTTGEIWVGNRVANTVSVVDREQARVIKELPTGDFPFRIAFTPDGQLAVVSCAESGDMQLFDATKKERVAAIPIHGDASEQSAMPMGLCIDPDGKYCYIACGRGEFLAVLDLATRAIVARIPAGRGPDGIAFARMPR